MWRHCFGVLWATTTRTDEALFPRACGHRLWPTFLQLAPSHTVLSLSLLIPRFPPRRPPPRPRRTCPPRRHASLSLPDPMARKPKTYSPSCDSVASSTIAIVWKYTKSMNMRDLARDDDYLSHLFIEKIASMAIANQMLVHRMDPRRRLPKTEAVPILAILHRVCHPMFLPTSFTHGKLTRYNLANCREAFRPSGNKASGERTTRVSRHVASAFACRL